MTETAAVFRSSEGEEAFRRAFDETVRRVVPDAERLRVATPSGPVHALVTGRPSAPPVVLLHGSGATSVGWAAELSDLGRDHRVIALDLPGEAAGAPGSRRPLVAGAHAAWLAEAQAALDIERPTVVGESLGGWIALDAATSIPDSVGPLLLLSSSGIGPRRLAPLLMAASLTAAGDRGRARALHYLTGPHPGRGAARRGEASPLTALALITFEHFIPRTDPLPVFSDESLERLSSPLRIVYGARDRMLDAPTAARRADARIAHADVVLLNGVGHVIPGRVHEVGSFVRAHTRGGGELGAV
jgi:pimeloyl-ACP methyl ester carboxylesterase